MKIATLPMSKPLFLIGIVHTLLADQMYIFNRSISKEVPHIFSTFLDLSDGMEKNKIEYIGIQERFFSKLILSQSGQGVKGPPKALSKVLKIPLL